MFKGNVGADSIKYNVFEVPIIAQWVRINPTRWRDRISLRAELFGCEYGMYSAQKSGTPIVVSVVFTISNCIFIKNCFEFSVFCFKIV